MADTETETERPSRRSKDPRSQRHIDGSASWTKLANPNPGKKYIWAYEGSTDTGAAYYASLGYQEEKAGTPDDPKPGNRVIAKKGEVYRNRGHVLMSIPLEDWLDIEQNGEDGHTGQSYADDLEARIRAQKQSSADLAFYRASGLRWNTAGED